MECLLTNPEGQAAKAAQMFPSARQDAIPVSCKKISVFINAGSASGSAHADTSIHSGGKGSGQPCGEGRNMSALKIFLPIHSYDLGKY